MVQRAFSLAPAAQDSSRSIVYHISNADNVQSLEPALDGGGTIVTGDGQRFLISAVVDTEPNAPLTVWVNWAAGVKKRP